MLAHRSILILACSVLVGTATLTSDAVAQHQQTLMSQFRTPLMMKKAKVFKDKRSVRRYLRKAQSRKLAKKKILPKVDWQNDDLARLNKPAKRNRLVFSDKSPNVKRTKGHLPKNGALPSGRTVPGAHAIPPVPVAKLAPADLGLSPEQRKLDSLRDKLGLLAPDAAMGPGAATNRGSRTPNGSTGAGTTQDPRDARSTTGKDGCVGPIKSLASPGERAGQDQGARAVDAAAVRTSVRDRVARELVPASRRADGPIFSETHSPGNWTWTWETGPGSKVEIVENLTADDIDRFLVTVVEGGRRVEMRSYDKQGVLQTQTQFHNDGTTTITQWDQSGDLVVRRRIDRNGEVISSEMGPNYDNPANPVRQTGNKSDPSQPNDAVTSTRDYWCETGVTNPDGPNGSRRQKPNQRGFDDRNIPNATGVIIAHNPSPTPEKLRAMVSQPGVDGEADHGNTGGVVVPAVSRFAQPPRGDDGRQDRSHAGTGLLTELETTNIPKPVDPD